MISMWAMICNFYNGRTLLFESGSSMMSFRSYLWVILYFNSNISFREPRAVCCEYTWSVIEPLVFFTFLTSVSLPVLILKCWLVAATLRWAQICGRTSLLMPPSESVYTVVDFVFRHVLWIWRPDILNFISVVFRAFFSKLPLVSLIILALKGLLVTSFLWSNDISPDVCNSEAET